MLLRSKAHRKGIRQRPSGCLKIVLWVTLIGVRLPYVTIKNLTCRAIIQVGVAEPRRYTEWTANDERETSDRNSFRQKANKTRSHRSRFITSICSEITVRLVPANRARMRSSPYRRLPSPNLPSIAFRSAESWRSTRLCIVCSAFEGRPSRGPLSRIPRSRQYCRFARVRYSLSASTASG